MGQIQKDAKMIGVNLSDDIAGDISFAIRDYIEDYGTVGQIKAYQTGGEEGLKAFNKIYYKGRIPKFDIEKVKKLVENVEKYIQYSPKYEGYKLYRGMHFTDIG